MNIEKNFVLSILALSMLSFNVCATAARFGGPEQVENRIELDRKGRVQPLKTPLAADGIAIAIDYSLVGFSLSDTVAGADDDASAGILRFYGSWKSTAGGSLIWKVEHRNSFSSTPPQGIAFNAGVSGLEVPPFNDQGARLTNFYWKQRLNNERTTITAGFLDVTDYVDVYAVASPWTGFMNFAFSTGSGAMALPGDAALGIAGATMLSEHFFVIAGITDRESDPTQPFKGFKTFFGDRNYFKSMEFGWTSSQDQILVDNFHITFWDADSSKELNQASDSGVNFSASKKMGPWLPFLRVGLADKGSLLGADTSVSTGFAFHGFGGRRANTIGAAVNWADVDNNDDQVTMEAFYLMKPLPCCEISPDIQIVQNPAMNPNENRILILGLRTRLIW